MRRVVIIGGLRLLLVVVLALAGCSADGQGKDEGTAGSGVGGSGGDGGAGGIGEGGTAGTGGVGGTGGTAGSGGRAPGGSGWYDDPEIWQPLPGSEFAGERCRLLQADPERIRRRILDWQPCGPGCERAALDLGLDLDPGLPVLTNSWADGRAVGILSAGGGIVGEERTRGFRATIRLDDGMLIGLAQVDKARQPPGGYSPCGFGRSSHAALATMADATASDGTTYYIYGAVDPATGAARWLAPWQTTSLCDRITVETPDGPTPFFNCSSAGYLAGSSDAIEVVTGDSLVIPSSGSSHRDMAVWSEFVAAGGSRIRAWKHEGGVRTLIEHMPAMTCGVAISATRLVGWQVPVGDHCDGWSTDLRLWHSPAAESADGIDVSLGPPLGTAGMGIGAISGWGDHAAIRVIDQASYDEFSLVVRLSDWTVRRIVPQAGHQVHFRSTAVTDRYVYWAEGTNVKTTGRISTVYRYDLTMLDEFGEPFGSPAETAPVD